MQTNVFNKYHLLFFTVLASIFSTVHSQYSCDEFSDCDYAGCNNMAALNWWYIYGCSFVRGIRKEIYTGNDAWLESFQSITMFYPSRCVAQNQQGNWINCPPPCKTSCPAGEYASNCVCVQCPINTFKSTSDGSSCVPCPGNTSSLAGSTNVTQCTVNAGYFGLPGMAGTQCEPGFYCPAGATVPMLCPNNTYAPNPRMSACLNCTGCSPGFFVKQACNPLADRQCELCQVGTYSLFVNQYICIQCVPGTYNSYRGSTSCLNCPKYTFAPSHGMPTCQTCSRTCNVTCPIGTAAVDCTSTQDNVCASCESGKYRNSLPQFQCVNCTRTCTQGFIEETPCTPLSDKGCKQCPSGFFCPNATAQLPCLLGHHCPVGSSSPTLCLAGTFANSTRMSSCMNCPVSTYGPSSGMSSCLNCPASKYAPSLGMTSCLSCVATETIGLYIAGCGGSDPGSIQRCTNLA
jgi:TNFR/NGFR cysteine-rich region/Tyrosine-protein kinase ephrin type A/B receptor-like